MTTRLALLLLAVALPAGCGARRSTASEEEPAKANSTAENSASYSDGGANASPVESESKRLPTPTRRIDRTIVEEDMEAIVHHFWAVATEVEKKKRLRSLGEEGAVGSKFLGLGVVHGLFPPELVPLLAMPGSGDTKADPDWVIAHKELPSEACSYCAPSAAQFLMSLGVKGRARRVILCPNQRIWALFPDEMPVFFSDADEVQWVSREDLEDEYRITPEEWADPAGKLFGKKAPFQFTYE